MVRIAMIGSMVLLLSACGMKGSCSYYNNCGCTDWYNTCSLH